jgi:hypothetical protein
MGGSTAFIMCGKISLVIRTEVNSIYCILPTFALSMEALFAFFWHNRNIFYVWLDVMWKHNKIYIDTCSVNTNNISLFLHHNKILISPPPSHWYWASRAMPKLVDHVWAPRAPWILRLNKVATDRVMLNPDPCTTSSQHYWYFLCVGRIHLLIRVLHYKVSYSKLLNLIRVVCYPIVISLNFQNLTRKQTTYSISR